MLHNNTVILCILTRQVCSIFVLKHITSWWVSETLCSGVKLRIGDICLLASKRNERDTISGKNNWKSGILVCLYYMCGHNVCHYVLWSPHIFVVARCSTLSQTSLNRIFWFIDHYPPYTTVFQRASEASEADSQSCSIEISDILVMCLSTNGERA